MLHPDFQRIRAFATLIGSIVGVGVFALPSVFARVGSGPALIALLFAAALTGAALLMYADLAAHTPGDHRFAGIVGAHLGPRAERVAGWVATLGFVGALLAFLVAGGAFGAALVGARGLWGEAAAALALAALVAAFSARGLRFAASLETWILAALAFLFSFVILACLPRAEAARLLTGGGESPFVAYGTALFALNGGIAAVPEMRALLGRRAGRAVPHLAVLGLAAVVALYAVFSLAVVSVTGARTSAFALDALVPVLGGAFGAIGLSLALLCVASIFLMVSVELQSNLRRDHRFSRPAAWFIATFVPVLLYAAGLRSFVDIIGFVGAVFAGCSGMLVVLAYERMRASPVCRDHACLELPRAAGAGMVACYAAGILAAFFSLII